VSRRTRIGFANIWWSDIQSWFLVGFKFLLYDVTSTFFEDEMLRNKKAARGYRRDSRPDCKQVCIGLVVTPEGLRISYEVFAGNRARRCAGTRLRS
jgi:hypothetical protein